MKQADEFISAANTPTPVTPLAAANAPPAAKAGLPGKHAMNEAAELIHQTHQVLKKAKAEANAKAELKARATIKANADKHEVGGSRSRSRSRRSQSRRRTQTRRSWRLNKRKQLFV
jgi:hypothetical protein